MTQRYWLLLYDFGFPSPWQNYRQPFSWSICNGPQRLPTFPWAPVYQFQFQPNAPPISSAPPPPVQEGEEHSGANDESTTKETNQPFTPVAAAIRADNEEADKSEPYSSDGGKCSYRMAITKSYRSSLKPVDNTTAAYSGVSEAESLTKDDDGDDGAMEEVARLQEEKKSLEHKVAESELCLTEAQTKLEGMNCEKNELSANVSQSRVDPSSEIKIGEFQKLLEQIQSELNKLSSANREISLTSSLQHARMSNLESKVEELQKLLTQTQMDLDKKNNDIAEAKATISRVQNEHCLQQQIKKAEESKYQSSIDPTDTITTPELESLKSKNNQLHRSLVDLEILSDNEIVEEIAPESEVNDSSADEVVPSPSKNSPEEVTEFMAMRKSNRPSSALVWARQTRGGYEHHAFLIDKTSSDEAKVWIKCGSNGEEELLPKSFVRELPNRSRSIKSVVNTAAADNENDDTEIAPGSPAVHHDSNDMQGGAVTDDGYTLDVELTEEEKIEKKKIGTNKDGEFLALSMSFE